MCGISGFNWKDESKLSRMVTALSHRGPDATGVFFDEYISLGHNRLSIIDLSSKSNQPMSDDGNMVTVVFNGEIYNFKELRNELKSNFKFKSDGDAEVILAGYKKWGKDVVNKLSGIFAFAIWDKQKKILICARDYAGVKPFYYYWDGSKFIFASEIKAILEHNMDRKLNIDAFNHYLRVQYVPAPMTMFEGIYKLPAKSILTLEANKLKVSTYNETKIEQNGLSYRENAKLLRGKVMEAVNRQLVSDVPVGVYLSGGIDSSAVLYSMSKVAKDIETFSVGFDVQDKLDSSKFNQDLELAKKTASFFGARHNSFYISAKDAADSFEETVMQCDDPISNPTSIAMLLLAKFAKSKVSVALTGSGGDELFGGYERYRMALGADYYKKLPALLRRIGNIHTRIAKLDYKDKVGIFSQFMFLKDEKISKIISHAVLNSEDLSKKYFNQAYFLDDGSSSPDALMQTDQESWLPDHFFLMSDRMSMKSALEERVPLVDKELIAFSKSIPLSHKLSIFRTKRLLKDAFKNDLPEYLFHQPKRGWFSPSAKWLRHPDFTNYAKEVLSQNYYEGTKDLFNWKEIELMLINHINMEQYNLTAIWTILTFQVWAKQFNVKCN